MTPALRHTIEGDWLDIMPVVAGSPPTGLGTPDLYVLAELADRRRVRVDVYRAPQEVACFEEARLLDTVIVVGFGARVHFVKVDEHPVLTTHALGAYFGSLFELRGSLLVASAERVFRFTPDGTLLWRSDVVGVDGVIVNGVDAGQVRGSGEWDPPGGWEPFLLDLVTGARAA